MYIASVRVLIASAVLVFVFVFAVGPMLAEEPVTIWSDGWSVEFPNGWQTRASDKGRLFRGCSEACDFASTSVGQA